MKKFVKLLAVLTLIIALPFVCSAEAAPADGFKVTSPNGAPGLALAMLAVDHPDNYIYVAAETIPAEFAKGEADFIIAPLNAGAKLYKAGKSTYQLAAVVTWGNLYFASQKEDFALEDINGGSVTLFGENTVNSSVALYALTASGVTPQTVEYLASAANTQALLLSDENAVVLTAEPALSAAKMKNEKITAYAVNDLYKKASGFDGYTQAGLFVRGDLAESQPEKVNAFLLEAQEACGKCASDTAAVAEAAVKLGILPNAKVAMNAIPNCAIRYLAAPEAREQVEATAKIDLAQYGGAVPADSFYYGAK